MSERPEQHLLDEVLAEAAPPDFRAALLAETLRQARRRRQFRLARRVAGVFAVLGLLAVFAAQQFSKPPLVSLSTAKIVKPSYTLVRTQPLSSAAMVTNKNFTAVKTVATLESVVQIATASGGFRIINDEQLLALVGATPAVLIRTGPNSEELVFANPEDRKRLWGN